MQDDRWNENIRLYPADRLFAWLVPVFPKALHPNHLTVLRVALVPFVVFFLHRHEYAIGVPLFLFASATDWFDGLLARHRRQITEWGIVYDKVADKLLIGATLFVVVFENVNAPLGLVLFVIEIAALTASFVQQQRGIVEQSNVWGKAKMIFEVAGITLLLIALWFDIDLLVELSTGTLAVALAAALASVYWRIR